MAPPPRAPGPAPPPRPPAPVPGPGRRPPLPAGGPRHAREHPLEPGMPVEALRHRLGLPDRALVEALVAAPLVVRSGRVSTGGPSVPAELTAAVDQAFAELAGPFVAPEANRLAELGLGVRQLGAAVRAGLVTQVAPGVVLPPDAADRAATVLAGIPQPFTL